MDTYTINAIGICCPAGIVVSAQIIAIPLKGVSRVKIYPNIGPVIPVTVITGAAAANTIVPVGKQHIEALALQADIEVVPAGGEGRGSSDFRMRNKALAGVQAVACIILAIVTRFL
ncbi:hypothetical protein BJP27_09680 [Pseudomonas oryzihabitans]|nr:hypothetical protein BJP27_09680 [Pseudomonas psychrotolerans]